jgi:hypothetical protein
VGYKIFHLASATLSHQLVGCLGFVRSDDWSLKRVAEVVMGVVVVASESVVWLIYLLAVQEMRFCPMASTSELMVF